MNEDRFEALLRDAGREYHRPPQTPREEMWARIAAARAERRDTTRVIALRPWMRWGLGMAAVLLIGFAVGRLTVHTEAPRGDSQLAYDLAAVQYLGRAEALLIDFRADARAGRMDTQFAGQARDLLTTTRLLLDSPAGRDARLKPLLEDLELVLAQIVSLPTTRDAQDVELINQGIDQRSVLTRLRTVQPGAAVSSHTQGVL